MTFRIFLHRDGTPLVFGKIEEQTLTIPFFYEYERCAVAV